MYGFSDEVTAKYFYYYFSNHFYDRVMAMTAKTSVDSVRYEMIADMDFSTPKLEEQVKISAYFESLDTLITLHQREAIYLATAPQSSRHRFYGGLPKILIRRNPVAVNAAAFNTVCPSAEAIAQITPYGTANSVLTFLNSSRVIGFSVVFQKDLSVYFISPANILPSFT